MISSKNPLEKGFPANSLTLVKEDGKITLIVDENIYTQPRAATWLIVAGEGNDTRSVEVPIRQEPDEPVTIAIDPTSLEFSWEGGTKEIKIETNHDNLVYEVTVPWITVDLNSVTKTMKVIVGKNTSNLEIKGEVHIGAGIYENNDVTTLPVKQTGQTDAQPMVFEMTITEDGTEASLPISRLPEKNVDCVVDWGDGSDLQPFSVEAGTIAETYFPSHIYEKAGVYEVRVGGLVPSLNSNQVFYSSKSERRGHITAVKNWGNTGLINMTEAFRDFVNLKSIPDDIHESFTELITANNSFYGCKALTTIPANLFKNAKQLANVGSIFGGSGIVTVPDELFKDLKQLKTASRAFYSCKSLTSFGDRVFAGCSELTEIWQMFWSAPNMSTFGEGTFEGCTKIDKLSWLFGNCTALTSIPQDFFKEMTKATDFANVFNGSGIKEVPEGLFSTCVLAQKFEAAFANCSELTTVCKDAFPTSTSLTTYSKVFQKCDKLTSIPADLFANANSVTNMSNVFDGCASLKSVSETLFSGCEKVTNFSSVFANCAELTAIPAGLFSNSPAVTNFSKAFTGCTKLTTLPESLFAMNVKVTNFSDLLSGCTGLTTVPAKLFETNIAVTNVSNMFLNCTVLTSVPVGIFDACLKISNFKATFSGCTNLTGESPYSMVDVDGVSTKVYLYQRPNYRPPFVNVTATNRAGCFAGCTKLSDYESIPDDWK